MEWEDIRDYVKERLEAVSGIGTVLDWQPNIRTRAQLDEYLTSIPGQVPQKRVNIWFLLRIAIRDTRGGDRPATLAMNEYNREDTFEITGFYNYVDRDSLIAFNNIIEGIHAKFMAEITLGQVEQGYIAGPAHTQSIADVDWFGILCHFCRIRITVRRHDSVTYLA